MKVHKKLLKNSEHCFFLITAVSLIKAVLAVGSSHNGVSIKINRSPKHSLFDNKSLDFDEKLKCHASKTACTFHSTF